MKNKIISATVLFALLLSIIPSLIIRSLAQDGTTEPLFTITVLVLNKGAPVKPEPSQIFLLEAEKLGISIKIAIEDWATILPRTMDYNPTSEQPYIPPYDEGDYDLFDAGWFAPGYEWTGYDIFLSTAMPPNGYNFYQLEDQNYDNLALQYSIDFNIAERIPYFKKIQKLLYNELPSLTYLYSRIYSGIRSTLKIPSFKVFYPQSRLNEWQNSLGDTIRIATAWTTSPSNPLNHYSLYIKSPMQIVSDAIYGKLFRHGIIPIPPSVLGFDKSLDPYTYDLELAAKYLRDASYTIPQEITSTSISTIVTTNSSTKKTVITLSAIIISLIGTTIVLRKKK